VKEAYYFDTGSSSFKVRHDRHLPCLTAPGRLWRHHPLSSLLDPYDEIAPYARRIPVMSSSLNNSMSGSVDDFFRMRKYDGEIYKAQNPRNLAISQYTSTPEEMKSRTGED
jgi:hypothetical protein